MSKIKPKSRGQVQKPAFAKSNNSSIPDEQQINWLLSLVNQGRLEDALIVAERITGGFGRFGFGWKVLGVLLYQLGRHTDAIASMQKAAALIPNDPEIPFNLGNIFKELHRFPEAADNYRRALAIDPNYGEAYSNLGVVQLELGQLHESEASQRKALALIPGSAGAHLNLGNALQALGLLGDAVASYRRATDIAPQYAEAHFCSGTALRLLGRSEEAISSFARAIEINPDYAEAYQQFGATLESIGKHNEAIHLYNKLLALTPDSPRAHYNLGNVLDALGRSVEAVEMYRQALEILPDYADAYVNMGNAQRKLALVAEAISSYRQALAIKPDYAIAYNNLGVVLKEAGQPYEAVEQFRRAIEVSPAYDQAHLNLGACFLKLDRLEEALECFRRALEINPGYAEAYNNFGIALQELGKLAEATESYTRAIEIAPSLAVARSNLLFTHAYHATLPPNELLLRALEWDAAVITSATRESARKKKFDRKKRSGRRLRVGYVSGDFRQHPISHFIEPVFRLHDRRRIELFAYSTTVTQDSVTETLQRHCNHWRVISHMSDEAVCSLVEEDAIDVLIDLSGHTEHNRLGLFASRAAPVQAHYLGYFATTGIAEMDYWFGDPVLFPEGADAYYCETIWRLPRVWVSYHGKEEAPASKWQPDRDGKVLLGSFNNLKKLTPATVALWAELLCQLPEARLLLKTRALADDANRKRVEDEFSAHGIGVDRLELIGKTDGWAAHMAMYDRLDIALDPVGGVGGGTTTCDALWMGVPVVTLVGEPMTQRMTASMLDAIGRRDWVAETESEYINNVVALAQNVEGRRKLRLDQREVLRNSALCDSEGLVQLLEDAYEAMFDIWWQKNSAECVADDDGVNVRG